MSLSCPLIFKRVVCVCAKSCLTLCDPMDCSLPGSSVLGIFQARILEWVAISFFRASSWPRDQTHISCIGRRILYHWATREAPRYYLLEEPRALGQQPKPGICYLPSVGMESVVLPAVDCHWLRSPTLGTAIRFRTGGWRNSLWKIYDEGKRPSKYWTRLEIESGRIGFWVVFAFFP